MAGRKPAGGKPVEVQALEPIKSGGKRHEPGAFVTVPSGQAEELFAIGHARPRADAEAEAQAKAAAEAAAQAKAAEEAAAQAKAAEEAAAQAKAAQEAAGGKPEQPALV
jgi:hypothetical protein